MGAALQRKPVSIPLQQVKAKKTWNRRLNPTCFARADKVEKTLTVCRKSPQTGLFRILVANHPLENKGLNAIRSKLVAVKQGEKHFFSTLLKYKPLSARAKHIGRYPRLKILFMCCEGVVTKKPSNGPGAKP
jgi:hypothetical protein